MSSVYDGLLAAVIADPDADLPRLVMADWYDENGQPERAQFIRLQIELARGVRGKAKRAAMEARAGELLAAHGEAWAAPLAELHEEWWDESCEFRRGFIERIATTGEVVEESGGRLFALTPLRELRLWDEEEYDGLAKCKHLLRLHTLDLTGSGLTSSYGSATLFRSRYLASLTTLIACGQDDNAHLDAIGVRTIAASKHLAGLARLDLGHNWFGPSGVVALVQRNNLAGLERLGLSGVGVEDAGALALARTPWLARLTELDLSHNGIGEVGCRALAESPHLAGLRMFDMRGNLGDEEPPGMSADSRRLLRRRFGRRVKLDGDE